MTVDLDIGSRPAAIRFKLSAIGRNGSIALLTGFALAIGCTLGSTLGSTGFAQSYPSKPVRLVVPFPPGGSAEAQARILAQKLGEIWGQPVVLDNKPGAGTTIGANFVAKAPADGYTLMMAYVISHTTAPSLYRSLPYDPIKSFAPVSLVVTQPLIVAVNASSPFGSLQALIETARAKPGVLSYSSSGTGVSPHLAAEILRAQADIQWVHVPFKGTSPALVAILGAQVDFGMQDAAALSNIQAGKLRALAVTTPNRWSQLPNVPTIAESGFPGFDVTSGAMVLAPAGTPRELIDVINAAIRRALAAPDVQQRYEAQGFDVTASTPDALGALLPVELAKYTRIIKALGLTAE